MSLPTDPLGRKFKSLRISLLQSCNLSCSYCVPSGDFLERSSQIFPEEQASFFLEKKLQIQRQSEALVTKRISNPSWNAKDLVASVAQIHQVCGLEEIRLTGGEPLLYPALKELISLLKLEIGIPIHVTSNGLLLHKMIQNNVLDGIDSINISLDTLSPEVFQQLTQVDALPIVLKGIETAISAGMSIKINTVMLFGINEIDFVPLLEYAGERKIQIRFLELMEMGHYWKQKPKTLTESDLLNLLKTRFSFEALPRKPHNTAQYFETTEGYIFGTICNNSHPFCQDCDRLRMDSQGKLYGCITATQPLQLTPDLDEEALTQILQKAMEQKQEVQFLGSPVSMLTLGG